MHIVVCLTTAPTYTFLVDMNKEMPNIVVGYVCQV